MNHVLTERIGAARRAVVNGERDGNPTKSVVAERVYDTTVEDLWDALTDRERIPRWFLPVEGDLRVGDVVLRDTASGTLLRLEHTVPVDEHWVQYGPGAVGIGWDLTLLGLEGHLSTGENGQLSEDVLAGPAGVEAITHSGDAWRTTDLASGTPGDVAHRAAEQTIAAYTGNQSER